MQIIQKACAGCGGAAIGAGVLAHAPCVLIALGMMSGVSAATAVGMSFYGSLAVMVASGAVLAQSIIKPGSAGLIKIGAASTLAAASLTMLWSHMINPANTQILDVQSDLIRAPNLSLLDRERHIRTVVCGQPRNVK